MKKSDSKPSQETPQEELKRLRKENARLRTQMQAQKDADKAKIEAMRKELKKKEEPKPVFGKEQWKRISNLLKDIDTQSR